MKIEGKVAIVTGGVSGIGKELTKKLIELKCKVVFADINDEEGIKMEQELNTNSNKVAMFCNCNVSSKCDIEKLFVTTIKEFKTVDIVINNAGLTNSEDRFEELNMVNVNLQGVINGTFYALQYFTKNNLKNRSIINIASMAGLFPVTVTPIYCATKAAVIMLGQCFSDIKNVRVNSVAPFFAKTNLTKPIYKQVNLSSSIVNAYIEKLGGWIEVSDIVRAVIRIIQDDSIKNQIISVNRNGLEVVKSSYKFSKL